MVEEKVEDDDTLDKVVFLYRAAPGQSEDSYGYWCASAADVPRPVVERALLLSRRRDAGELIHPLGQDPAEAEKERKRRAARDALLGQFFAYDFRAGTASDFFAGSTAPIDTLSRFSKGARAVTAAYC